jgi:CDP-diglyceride synthetase
MTLIAVLRGKEPIMSRPTETQTGAFFGILASALIFVLTAMALVSVGAQSSRPHHSVSAVSLNTPAAEASASEVHFRH